MLNHPRSTPIRIPVLLSLAAIFLFAAGIGAAAPAAQQDLAPFVSAPASVQTHEGVLLQFTVTASDPDGDPILFLGIAGGSPGICLSCFVPNPDNTSGTFSWTPGYEDAGSYSVTFEAVTATATAVALTAIQVLDTDRPPVVTAPVFVHFPLFVEGTFTVSAADPDGDAIQSLTAAPLPPGATFTTIPDDTAGTFTWTPGFADEGTWLVTFTASNALSGTAQTTIEAGGSDRAPVVTAPATAQTDEGAALVFDVTAADPEGDPLLLTALGLPPGAAFTDHGDNTGTFSWTPDFSQAGVYSVTFRATDPQGITGQAITSIQVFNVNRPPVADAGGPYFGFQDIPIPLDGTGSFDPDGETLTYSWDFGDGSAGLGATVSHAYSTTGTFTATLTVADSLQLSDTDDAAVTVGTSCHASVFATGSNQKIRLGSGKATWCAQFEPELPGCFPVDQIDADSFTLTWPAGGSMEVHAIPQKTNVAEDQDHDGLLELEACFAKDDLRALFASLPVGETEVSVQISARTTAPLTGFVVGDLAIIVVKTGGALAARITPSPLHASGEISFQTRRPGPARVRLFDLQGRLVRTLLEDGSAAAGSHAVRFDGRGRDGAPLAAGVYFFRIDADGTEETGRVVIAR